MYNNLMNNLTKKQKISLLLICIFIVGIIAMMIFVVESYRQTNKTGVDTQVEISGYDKCKGLSDSVKQNIFANISQKVDSIKKYNNTTENNFKAEVRDGFCVVDDNNETATIIVDIPDARQSWLVSYSTNKDTQYTEPRIECPASDQIIYGDFDCKKLNNAATYDLSNPDDYDPIMDKLPLVSTTYIANYDISTKTITIKTIPMIDADKTPEGKNAIANDAKIDMTNAGIDLSKYNIVIE